MSVSDQIWPTPRTFWQRNWRSLLLRSLDISAQRPWPIWRKDLAQMEVFARENPWQPGYQWRNRKMQVLFFPKRLILIRIIQEWISQRLAWRSSLGRLTAFATVCGFPLIFQNYLRCLVPVGVTNKLEWLIPNRCGHVFGATLSALLIETLILADA